MVTRKGLKKLDSIKPICLLWNVHKSGPGFLAASTKRKSLSTVQEINSKNSEEALFLVLQQNSNFYKVERTLQNEQDI